MVKWVGNPVSGMGVVGGEKVRSNEVFQVGTQKRHPEKLVICNYENKMNLHVKFSL